MADYGSRDGHAPGGSEQSGLTAMEGDDEDLDEVPDLGPFDDDGFGGAPLLDPDFDEDWGR